jgi:hypothetical protein
MRMRRFLLLTAAAVAAAATLGLTAARAATVEVSVVNCYFNQGGNATVPAGSTVVFRVGWLDKTSGYVKRFLRSQTTTATLDSAAVADANSLWGPIQKFDNHTYVTFWRLSAGTLANPGDSTTLEMQVTVNKAITGVDPDTGKPAKFGPGPIFPSDFGCTVTAV